MTETARLVLAVDSSQVKTADKSLEKLEATGKRTERATDQLGASFKRLAGPLAAAAAIAGGAALAGAGIAIKRAINEMDELSKTAQKVGVTTEALSELTYAAQLADVAAGELQFGLVQLIKSMDSASRGSKLDLKAFEDLGVQFLDSAGKLRTADAVLLDIADRFGDMEDGAKKTALSLDLFGRSGANMIPLLNGGAKSLRDAATEARQFGKVVTTEAGRAAEEFNDNLHRLQSAMKGAAIQMATDLLPALVELSDQVVEMAKDPAFRQDLANAISTIGNATISTARGITNMTNALGFLYDEAKQAVGIVDSDDLVRLNEELQKAKDKVGREEVGGIFTSWTKQAQAARDEVARLEKEIAAAESKMLARKSRGAIQEIDLSGLPQRRRGEAPSSSRATGAVQQTLAYAKALLSESDDIMRDIEQRMAERAAAFEGIEQIKLSLLDAEGQALANLQDKYEQLREAVELGAVSQEEAARVSADLAREYQDGVAGRHQQELDALTSGLLSEEEEIQQSYERRRQEILESTIATATEKNEILAKLEQDHAAKVEAVHRQKLNNQLNMSAYYVGALGTLMQSSNAKLFAVGKAAAIAEATIKGYQAVVNALADVPYPYNYAAAAAVGVAAAVQVANIAGTQYSGAYDKGGEIPAGSFGMVGERGPEIVYGPATVVSRQETAALMREGGSQAPVVNTRIINLFEGQVIEDYLGSDKMEKITINRVRRNRNAYRSALGL